MKHQCVSGIVIVVSELVEQSLDTVQVASVCRHAQHRTDTEPIPSLLLTINDEQVHGTFPSHCSPLELSRVMFGRRSALLADW